MAQAVYTITDIETGSGLTLYLDDTSTPENVSPPFSDQGRDWKRAIVKHEIPTAGNDIGQDMGAYSREYNISGICQQNVKDQFESWASLTQFTVANPSGRFHVIMQSRTGATLYDIQPLALYIVSWKLMPGTANWFKLSAKFYEFHQT